MSLTVALGVLIKARTGGRAYTHQGSYGNGRDGSPGGIEDYDVRASPMQADPSH